jgi:ABC-type multidrug transport system fused ATPase/permease subunit
VQAILSFFRVYLFEVVSQRGMGDIRKTLYRRIITQPVAFFEKNRTGDLISRISSDVSQLQDSLSMNLAMFIRQSVLPMFSIPRLLMISPRLTLIMVSTFPPLIIATIFFARFIRRLARESQDALAASGVVAEETIMASDVVKSFTNEGFESNRYAGFVDKVIGISLHASRYRAAFISFIIFAFTGCILFIIYQGLSLVSDGTLTIGKLVEFLIFTVIIGTSIGGLSESYTVIQKTVGASERINEILEEEPEININDETQQAKIEGAVEFRNVNFSYPSRSDVKIFSELSFTADKGEKVALVGPSGSGKSTIIKLLSGFYPFQGGEIVIDGKPIDSYDLTALRKNIGMVPQEVILFGGSIRENIAYGKTNATEAEIIEAAKKANAWDFIDSFPEKLDTLVGERGLKLSGGQKQRVAIARAILRDPKILILDEATSALDSESEKLVKDALDKLMQGRTTFIIAHRLSTIREADKILVINKGKIVEQGSHEALLNMPGGLYANLIKLQYEVD